METIQKTTAQTFNYQLIRETEKAVFAKVPFWEATSLFKKKHKQLFYECWIPKSVISNGTAKGFVIQKKNDARLKNSYQRVLYDMPDSWRTMGEYAPEKTKEVVEEIDKEKLQSLRTELMKKHNVTDYDQGFFINPTDDITEEIEALAKAYRNPKRDNPIIPKINVTYYK